MNAVQVSTNGIKMRMVETLALILTFSPGEKEQPSYVFRFADGRPANPVAGTSVRRRMILPLLGGEGRGEGERETFSNAKAPPADADCRFQSFRRDLTARQARLRTETFGRLARWKHCDTAGWGSCATTLSTALMIHTAGEQ